MILISFGATIRFRMHPKKKASNRPFALLIYVDALTPNVAFKYLYVLRLTSLIYMQTQRKYPTFFSKALKIFISTLDEKGRVRSV